MDVRDAKIPGDLSFCGLQIHPQMHICLQAVPPIHPGFGCSRCDTCTTCIYLHIDPENHWLTIQRSTIFRSMFVFKEGGKRPDVVRPEPDVDRSSLRW